MKVIQDTPLNKVSDDKLGRENIVDLIVGSINDYVQKDHPCLVYGIYGKWGEGKTSLLNFVEEKLLAQGGDDNINIIKFNPWLVNNDETLLREFFKSMTRRLDDKTREIFEKYGSLAGYFNCMFEMKKGGETMIVLHRNNDIYRPLSSNEIAIVVNRISKSFNSIGATWPYFNYPKEWSHLCEDTWGRTLCLVF